MFHVSFPRRAARAEAVVSDLSDKSIEFGTVARGHRGVRVRVVHAATMSRLMEQLVAPRAFLPPGELRFAFFTTLRLFTTAIEVSFSHAHVVAPASGCRTSAAGGEGVGLPAAVVFAVSGVCRRRWR